VCFGIEIILARPDIREMATGLIPSINDQSLYVAIGILGATVMPHNLYLHSALVQTRRIGPSPEAKRAACRFNLIDSVIALNGALFVNAAILIVAASVFYSRGLVVTEIEQAHLLLAPLLGTAAASVLFALALLCAGQSSTLTGTMAGQIVMEGFLNFRMRPWLRRLITRMIAIIPAVVTIVTVGEQGTYRLLIFSQVVLSMQLPFAVIPLIHFTSDRRRMGSFANPAWLKVAAWLVATVIVGLNMRLLQTTIAGWLTDAGEWRTVLLVTLIPIVLVLLGLLVWITLEPLLPAVLQRRGKRPSVELPRGVAANLATPAYQKVLVPLDHSPKDRIAISHAAALARTYGAELILLHVEEDPASQLYGDEARTAEVAAGEDYLGEIAASLREKGISVQTVLSQSGGPANSIVRVAKEQRPDLVIMGAHGHSGLKDLVFGATINDVRHRLATPILVVREEDGNVT
jgi:manganese transport protein